MNLKEKLEALQRKSAALVELASAGTVLTDEQVKDLDTTTTEIESVTKQLSIIEKAQAQNAAARQPVNQLPQPIAGGSTPQAEVKAMVAQQVISTKHLDMWQGSNREEKAQQAYGFGQWAIANLLQGVNPVLAQKAREYCNTHGGITKAHTERDNETGGLLVPGQFINSIIDLRNQYGQFRRFATVFPMSSDTATRPRRKTGLTAYWGSESGALTDSTMGWDAIQLTAKKLYVYATMSTELAEDAVVDMASYLAMEMAYQLAKAEDEAGFIGDGTSTYGGIVGATSKIKALDSTIANIAGLYVGTGNLYSELTLVDFEQVLGKSQTYVTRREWFASPTFYYTVMLKLALAAGGVSATEIVNGFPGRPLFLGYPVNLIEVMPKVEANSQVCALFGDMSLAATLGDRRRVTVSQSEHVRFAYDDLVVKATQRVDINVHDVGNASATAGDRVPGPIVGLITAAS